MKSYDELITSIHKKASVKIRQRKKYNRIFLLSLFSLCFVAVIVAGAVNILPQFLKNNIDTPLKIASPDDMDKSLTGLVVDNFKLSNIQADGVSDDRMVITKLSDFFQLSPPDMFVYVRVFDTKQWTDKKDGYHTLKQQSSVYVISNLWNKNIDIPQSLTITQSLYGGCIGDEKTNMLRKDGVYLLPLTKWKESDNWQIYGDLDVLFEVDNKGEIWSHSQFEGLNCYDGKEADTLSNDMIMMTSNENFATAISSFGTIARQWGVLAQTKVSSVEKTKDKLGYDCYAYALGEIKVLSAADNNDLKIDKKDRGAISYHLTPLEIGTEYLLFFDLSVEDRISIDSGRIAKISEKNTIVPMTSTDSPNIFTEYSGYTVEQVKNKALRAKTWQAEFGDK